MDDSLFRKVSLERLSSPEQIDQLMKIRSPSGWIVLSSAIVLLVVGCIWLFFGKIPVTVPCEGNIMPVEGLAEVQSAHTLAVEDVYVQTGAFVQSNDILVKGKLPETETEFLVKAPCTGTVTDVYVNEGAVATPGTTIVRIEPTKENGKTNLCAIMYVSVSDGVKLTGGEDAFVSPAGISLERYGYVCGKVETVGRYPEYKDGQHNVAVRVSLSTDSRSGRLDYTYRRVPQETPHGGTPCTGYILLGHISPAEMVLPWLAAKDES